MDAAGANEVGLSGAVDLDFDPLEIREELTQRFADNLGPGSAFSFDHTAAFILVAWGNTFFAYETGSCHDKRIYSNISACQVLIK